MILVYTPRISSRIEYISGLLLGNILGADWECTSDKKRLEGFNGPKISYGKQPPARDTLHIPASGFLMERGVHFFFPEMDYFDDLPALFPVPDPADNTLHFDLFAAAFYLVSRYEEYLPHHADAHGRFQVSESFAYKNKFYTCAVVNRYALLIKKRLLQSHQGYPFKASAFSFMPTYDIDVAYAYQGRSLFRNLFGIMRSVGQLDIQSLKKRFMVIIKKEKDPFDTYDYQLELSKKYGIKAYYFFLCADYGPYDKNLAPISKKFVSLVKTLGDYAHIGIHPSYRSNVEEDLLQNEINRLAGILNQEIHCSRQHYLKMTLPKTYQILLKHDVRFDFTMGFAGRPGFRASIATPFQFYDLELEKETPLIVVPLTVMDGTLRNYMGLSPAEAWQVVKQLIMEAEEVGGTFSTLWHNDTLRSDNDPEGWVQFYEKMYHYASKKHIKTQNNDPLYSARKY
ncbi:MAG: hypothetical protein EA394_03930 [Bacteroidia bacterium]|nr:MAG: hypothetical protein EA394_03930 [Bacteroidia bacterium]